MLQAATLCTRREGQHYLVKVQRMWTCGKVASCSRVGVLTDSATVRHHCPMQLMLRQEKCRTQSP